MHAEANPFQGINLLEAMELAEGSDPGLENSGQGGILSDKHVQVQEEGISQAPEYIAKWYSAEIDLVEGRDLEPEIECVGLLEDNEVVIMAKMLGEEKKKC
jgi:hypothetical protein